MSLGVVAVEPVRAICAACELTAAQETIRLRATFGGFVCSPQARRRGACRLDQRDKRTSDGITSSKPTTAMAEHRPRQRELMAGGGGAVLGCRHGRVLVTLLGDLSVVDSVCVSRSIESRHAVSCRCSPYQPARRGRCDSHPQPRTSRRSVRSTCAGWTPGEQGRCLSQLSALTGVGQWFLLS